MVKQGFLGRLLTFVCCAALVTISCAPCWGSIRTIDSIGVYNVYEKTFTDPSHLKPAEKSNQKINVTFTKPGIQDIVLPGFWDGGDNWAFRAALPEQGTWHWVVNAPGRCFDGAEGRVSVNNSSNKGFVQRNPNYPHTVSYSRNHIPVFVWGNTAYEIVKQELEGNTAAWHEFVDKSKEYGMNKIRFLITMWNFGSTPVDGSSYCPWENCTYENPRYNAFNTDYWDALDKIVQYMQSKGVIANIILFPDGPVPGHNDNGNDPNGREGTYNMSEQQEEAYVKYAVARFAAYTNVSWCIANEWNIGNRARYEGVTTLENGKPAPYFKPDFSNITHIDESGKLVEGGYQTKSWVNHIGNYLYNTDPYIARVNRLTSVHNAGNNWFQNNTYKEYNFQFSGENWATYVVIQYHREDRATKANEWGHFSIMQNRDDNVPVFNDEYGYEGYHCNRKKESSCTTPAMSRKAGWGIAIAGGYGSWGDDTGDENGDHAGVFGYAGGLLGIWRGNAKTPPAIKVMTGIMRSLKFWKMRPNDDLIVNKPSHADAYLLADPGNQYLMYAANGGYSGDFTIHIKAGSYQGRWIETTSGNQVGSDISFTLNQDKDKVFHAPDFSHNTDIVLKLVSDER